METGLKFINWENPFKAWDLNTVAEIVTKVNEYAKKKGFQDAMLEEVEDNTWEDTKNQRYDITIIYFDGSHQVRQKLLILKDEVLDGMEFHKRFNEFYDR